MGALIFLSSCCNGAGTKAYFNLGTVFAGARKHGVACKIITSCSNLHHQSSLPFQKALLGMGIDSICCSHTCTHMHCELYLIVFLLLIMILGVINTHLCTATAGDVHYPSTYWNLQEK